MLRRNTLSQEDLSDPPSPQELVYTQANSRHSVAAPQVGSTGYSVAGYYATHDAQNNVSHGSLDHRRLRRSQSAITSTQLMSEDDSPPNSGIGQVVKVDISRSKSEYASVAQTLVSPNVPEPVSKSPTGVMSSFRPSDSAKLYASPEQIKIVGYHNPELLAQLNLTKNTNGNIAKSRSQSLPPVTSRPAIAQPPVENNTSVDSGIYSSTHSTFRGTDIDRNNSQCDDNDLPLPLPPTEEDMMIYAKPQNNKIINNRNGIMSSSYTMSQVEPSHYSDNRMSSSFTGPSSAVSSVMPEPDYSSEEDSTYNSQCDNSQKNVTIKRKKHSVAFAPNVVINSNIIREAPHYAAPYVQDASTPAVVASSASPPLPSPPPEAKSENFSELIAKKAAERRVRQESCDNVSAPSSTTSSPNRRTGPEVPAKGLSDAILESALFNKQKEKASNGGESGKPRMTIPKNISKSQPIHSAFQKMKNSTSCPNELTSKETENSPQLSGNISSELAHKVDNTYVTVINTESNVISKSREGSLSKSNSVEDSSISSDSSEDASDRTWILTNERSDQGVNSEVSTAKRGGTLTRNAVSLVKLPPPQEKTEIMVTGKHGSLSNSFSESERGSHSLPSQHLPLSHPLASSHPLPHHLQGAIHPFNTHVGQAKFSTLQRPHSNSRIYKGNLDPPVGDKMRNVGGGTLVRSRSSSREEANINSGCATLDRNFYQSTKGSCSGNKRSDHERSIDESLQLIRMHMNSLNEVNCLAGIPLSKHCKDSSLKEESRPKTEEVLAPPPQFSDPSAQMRNQRETQMSNEETPIRVYKRSNRRLEEEFTSAPEDVSFRHKSLDEWTTRDTTDWLESLFMPEYKDSFENKQIDGSKLLRLNNESLINLGVRRVGHRVNMEKSLKRYRPIERIDL